MKRSLLILSAIAFLCQHIHQSSDAIGVAAAIPFLIFYAVKRPVFTAPRVMNGWGKAFCALTAMGVCLWPIEGFAGWLRSITAFQRFQSFLGVEAAPLSQIAAAAFAAAGLWFVYQMIILFYERFFAFAKEIAGEFTRAEGYTALAASVILIAAVVTVYANTDAFASPTVTRDLIYTADSGAIVHENAYLSLFAVENDFRSPLFTLFSAPLLGFAYLLGRLLPFPNAVATVLTVAQAPLLAASCFLWMKLIRGVSKPARFLLPVLLLCAYGPLLFALMPEQYTVALFYLSLGLYSIAGRGRREQWLVLGAAGTMLPGAALAFLPERKGKPIAAVLMDALKSGLRGFVLLCAFGGFGVLLRIPETLQSASRFTGAGVPFQARVLQFLSFVGQCFAAPKAGGVLAADGYWKWRLAETGDVSILGVAVLALAALGFLLNRRQRYAKLCLAWVLVSFLLLCILGWGTAENGLTLYTLYFGWAYAGLLVYFAESVCKALQIARFSWILYALAAAALLWHNLPRLVELARFALTYYPI